MTDRALTETDGAIEAVAARHGLGRGAVAALWDAMRRGGGSMAQFSHPELGGMGQWSRGGMLQIGDMFDQALKARVAAACADLAEQVATDAEPREAAGARGGRRWQAQGVGAATEAGERADWWPGAYGPPSASGSQNGLRYAVFAQARRLAIGRVDGVTIYDTGRHRIFGVSQSQSRGQRLAFTADDGTMDVDTLPVVEA